MLTAPQSAQLLASQQDLQAITGLKQSCAQSRALVAMGIPHRRRPCDGAVLLSAKALEDALGGKMHSQAAPSGPKWSKQA